MKKTSLFYLFLPVGLIASFITLNSYTTGFVAFGTGCSCHGNANNATIIGITGVPASGYVPGTVYTLTATVTNSTKVAAGIDIHTSAGTLDSIIGQGTVLNTGDIAHTYPKTMISGTSSFNFKWTAPSNNTATFSIAGNAVNFDFDEGGDAWWVDTFTFASAWAAEVTSMNQLQYEMFPNPTFGIFYIKDVSPRTVISLYNMMGLLQHMNVSIIGHNAQVDASSLSAGMYILQINTEGKRSYKTILKN